MTTEDNNVLELPKTPKEAKAIGSLRYYSGPCKNGHTEPRLTSSRMCPVCGREQVKKRRKENIQKFLDREKKYRDKNSEMRSAYYRKWREIKRKDPKWVNEHRDKGRKQAKRLSHNWRANGSKRRAIKKKSAPPWLTKEHLSEIRSFYKEAKLKSAETGQIHHVDHIHPLSGKNFCGLHVPWNMCVISGAENWSKGNKLPPDVDTW